MYKTQFKISNIYTESSTIDVTENLKIISGPNVQSEFGAISRESLLQMGSINEDFGINRFLESLSSSDVMITCTTSSEIMENSPFSADDISYAGVALAILKDEYFVVGIEKFTNLKGDVSWGPWTTCFDGIRGGRQAQLKSNEEEDLRKIYSFVYSGFTGDTEKAKLIHLFCKCTCLSLQNNFHVLKVGLPNFGNTFSTRIINAVLMLEMIFGDHKAKKIREKIKVWNQNFVTQLDPDNIVRIMNYRHMLVHDDANYAKENIKKWLEDTGISSQEGFDWAYQESLITIKRMLREIALDFDNYKEFN